MIRVIYNVTRVFPFSKKMTVCKLVTQIMTLNHPSTNFSFILSSFNLFWVKNIRRDIKKLQGPTRLPVCASCLCHARLARIAIEREGEGGGGESSSLSMSSSNGFLLPSIGCSRQLGCLRKGDPRQELMLPWDEQEGRARTRVAAIEETRE